MAKKKPEAQKANYVIGAPWPKGGGSICDYNYWGVVHFGTMEEAEVLLKQIQQRIARDEEDEKRYSFQPTSEDFQIYQVVPIK